MSMLLIEVRTKKYAEVYEELSGSITSMENEIETIKNKPLPGIKSLLVKLKPAAESLYSIINENKGLFDNPKTQIFHNIRVGLAKGKGRKEFNSGKTIKLIRKWFPRKAKQLIKIDEKVISAALDKLSVTELKR